MSINLKKAMRAGLVMGCLAFAPSGSWAGESPVLGGGNFGLGLEIGEPGAWGAVGKFWVDKQNAFQPAVKLGYGSILLQLDYLWHTFDVVQPKEGLLPLYFGVGGDLFLQGTMAVAVRGPVGISYLFNKTDVPIDVYVQLVPLLWIYSNGTLLQMDADLGARYYF
jgi:hypothetical protein